MNKKISEKDKKDWEDFISKNESLPIKDDEFIKKNIPETLTFDLHGYSLDEANIKVKDIIFNSYEAGIKKLVLITGKGIHSTSDKDAYISKDLGKLKYSVPDYIKTNTEINKLIVSIHDAEKKDGGEGAIVIKFKNLYYKFR